MSEDRLFEITISVRGPKAGDEAVRHIEGPMPHETANDIAAEVVDVLDSRSGRRLKTIPHTDR